MQADRERMAKERELEKLENQAEKEKMKMEFAQQLAAVRNESASAALVTSESADNKVTSGAEPWVAEMFINKAAQRFISLVACKG